MRILLTNDDGIRAPGIVALYRELIKLGEVHVIAPETVQSATGHGITLEGPILTNKVTIEGAFTGTAVEGRPADCVKLAIAQLMPERPDLVVSGMNAGVNVGINVIYSGTVAAAIEAAFLGLPSIAVSMMLSREVQPPAFAYCAKLARETIEQILQAGLHEGQVVSVNIPPLSDGQNPTGTRVARQCVNSWMDTYEKRTNPRGKDYYWNSSVFTLVPSDQDTDTAGIRDGYITITPLQYDLTHYTMLKDWEARDWTRRTKPE